MPHENARLNFPIFAGARGLFAPLRDAFGIRLHVHDRAGPPLRRGPGALPRELNGAQVHVVAAVRVLAEQ